MSWQWNILSIFCLFSDARLRGGSEMVFEALILIIVSIQIITIFLNHSFKNNLSIFLATINQILQSKIIRQNKCLVMIIPVLRWLEHPRPQKVLVRVHSHNCYYWYSVKCDFLPPLVSWKSLFMNTLEMYVRNSN